MDSTKRTTLLAIAGAMTAAAAGLAQPAKAADMEKCYGIALKGQNDCAAGKHDCAGKSTMNYDKLSFKLVPVGTCIDMKVHGHQGKLTPA